MEETLYREVIRAFQDFSAVLKSILQGRVSNEQMGRIDRALMDCAKIVLKTITNTPTPKVYLRKVIKIGNRKKGFSWYVGIPAKVKDKYMGGWAKVRIVDEELGVLIIEPER